MVIDDLDFERVKNLVEGFGWKVTSQSVKDVNLEITFEKKREEPESDITVMPT